MTKDTISSTSTTTKPIIALDCDGVLLDYHTAFAQIYEKVFGKQLTLVAPKSYHVSLIRFILKKRSDHMIYRLEKGMVLILLMRKKFNLMNYGMNMVGEQCQCMMEPLKHVFYYIKLVMN